MRKSINMSGTLDFLPGADAVAKIAAETIQTTCNDMEGRHRYNRAEMGDTVGNRKTSIHREIDQNGKLKKKYREIPT